MSLLNDVVIYGVCVVVILAFVYKAWQMSGEHIKSRLGKKRDAGDAGEFVEDLLLDEGLAEKYAEMQSVVNKLSEAEVREILVMLLCSMKPMEKAVARVQSMAVKLRSWKKKQD